MTNRCACGSSDIFAIKPGVNALYAPGNILIEREVPTVFTCRACLLKSKPKELKIMDRLVIELSGDLPEEGKYAILADAQEGAKGLAANLKEKHGLDLKVSARPVRPGKKTAAGPMAVAQAAE